MVSAIEKELVESKAFFNQQLIQTIYFGGGTPSLLNEAYLSQILTTIQKHYKVSSDAEITLEANPDDIQQPDILNSFHSMGFNRLSLGIQSFNEAALRAMNRAHTEAMSWNALEYIHRSDFRNFSVDLIHSLPFLSVSEFEQDLEAIMSINAPHVSTYSLTIEERTVFGHRAAKGELKELDEDLSAIEYELLLKSLTQLGYRNYEISNFGKPGFESSHNMNYWDHKPYLGVGPGAHSFDGSRRWSNIRNNALYIRGMEHGSPKREFVELGFTENVNEYILTSLRTDTGVSPKRLLNNYNVDILALHSEKVDAMRKNDLVFFNDGNLRLTDTGKLLADQIAMDLFIDET